MENKCVICGSETKRVFKKKPLCGDCIHMVKTLTETVADFVIGFADKPFQANVEYEWDNITGGKAAAAYPDHE